MGGKSSKGASLPRSDLDWLIAHTKYNEQTILEWHKGFRSTHHPASLMPHLNTVEHSHWSRSVEILSSYWWNFNRLVPRSMP